MKAFYTLIVLASLLLEGTQLHAQIIHGIIVADTKDASIGEAAKEDSKRIATFLNLIGQALDYSVSTQIIAPTNSSLLFGSRFETSEITSAILNLSLEQEDIFFFYYSGHGLASRDSDDPFARPVIGADKYDYLSLQMIQKLAAIHQPRLSIVMGNLCNSLPGSSLSTKYADYIEWTNPHSDNSYASSQIRSLFAELEGSITVTSSHRGMTSFSQKDGGVFTKLFISCFSNMLKEAGSPSWELLLTNTARASTESFDRTPYFEINLKPKTR